MVESVAWLSGLGLFCALAGLANITAKTGTTTRLQNCRADGKRLHIASSLKEFQASEFIRKPGVGRLDRGAIGQLSVNAPVPEFLNFARRIRQNPARSRFAPG